MMRRLSLQPSSQAARHAFWRHGSHINGDRRIRRRNDASTFASSAQICRESNCSPSDGSNVPKLQHWQRQMHEHSHVLLSSRLSLFSPQHTHLLAARSFSSKMPKKIDLRSILRQPVKKTVPDAPGSQSMKKQNDAVKSSTSNIDSSKQTDNGVLPTSGRKMLPEIAPIATVSVNADANPVPKQDEAQTYGDLLSQKDNKEKTIEPLSVSADANPVPKQEEAPKKNDLRSIFLQQPAEKTVPNAPGSQSMMKQNDAIKSSTSDIDSSKQTNNAVLPTSGRKRLPEIAPIAPVSVNADANPVPKQEDTHTYGDLLIQNDIKEQHDNPVPKQEEVWTDEDWRIQKDIKENSIAPVSDYVYADPVPQKEEAQTYETPVLSNEDDSSRTRLDSEEPPNETRREGSMDNVQFVDGPATQFGSGVIANLCHGSIVGTAGSTVVLSTVVFDSSSEGPNFENSGMVPLQVEYRERHHGVGQISTNSRRRDNSGPMTDDEILASRAIDRVLRPLLPKESYSSTLAITCS
eukprot:scaffold17826_cov55-Attheya_sp.AAC.1